MSLFTSQEDWLDRRDSKTHCSCWRSRSIWHWNKPSPQADHKKSWDPTKGCQIKAVVCSVPHPTWLWMALSFLSLYLSTFLHRPYSALSLLTQPVWLTHCFSTFHHQSQLCRVRINAAWSECNYSSHQNDYTGCKAMNIQYFWLPYWNRDF